MRSETWRRTRRMSHVLHGAQMPAINKVWEASYLLISLLSFALCDRLDPTFQHRFALHAFDESSPSCATDASFLWPYGQRLGVK
jgi:hypothetical protein